MKPFHRHIKKVKRLPFFFRDFLQGFLFAYGRRGGVSFSIGVSFYAYYAVMEEK
jgi:hypothetical protein